MLIITTDRAFTYDEIAPGLFQGSKPPFGPTLKELGLDVLVLTAREIQPASVYFPGVEVVHAPIDDMPDERPLDRHGLSLVLNAARRATNALAAGRRVLVTCAAGMNRSGLVSAVTLIMSQGLSGRAAIETVKRNRRWGEDGYQPLSNPQFVAMLSRVPGKALPEPEPLEVCFEVSWQ